MFSPSSRQSILGQNSRLIGPLAKTNDQSNDNYHVHGAGEEGESGVFSHVRFAWSI
jgi:hypothetical protein